MILRSSFLQLLPLLSLFLLLLFSKKKVAVVSSFALGAAAPPKVASFFFSSPFLSPSSTTPSALYSKQPQRRQQHNNNNNDDDDERLLDGATILSDKLRALLDPNSNSSSSSGDKGRLPIHDILPRVWESLLTKPNLLLEAPPGAGKTTMVPLAMLLNNNNDCSEKKVNNNIWVVEPRRVAVRSAANRMAALLNERVGGTVGYAIRGERRVSSKSSSSCRTQITVVTDGILLQRLRHDPELSGIDMVIFDEFHERGVGSDVALALTRESQRLWRQQQQQQQEEKTT